MNAKFVLLMIFIGISIVFIAIAAAIPTEVFFPWNILSALLKLLFLVIGLGFDVLAFSSRYYTYLLSPIISQRKRHIILNDQPPYWLASTGDAILSKPGNDFIATTFINIPFYVSASEMSDDDKARFSDQVSRLIGLSFDPVKFTTQLRVMDKDSYIKKIKEAISLAENEESQLVQSNGPQPQIDRARGKLAMWKKMLDHISSKPSSELITYAAISATGSKEYEALTIVQQKTRDLMNGIGSILGVSPNVVVGEEILKFVEPEHMIPLSTISEQISKKIEHGEMN
jgi:hypothetical protein